MINLLRYRDHVLGAIDEMSDETLLKHLEVAKRAKRERKNRGEGASSENLLLISLINAERKNRGLVPLVDSAEFDEWGLPVG